MKLRRSKHLAIIIALIFMFSMFPGYGMAEEIQPSSSLLMETVNPPLDNGEVSGSNQDDGESDVNLPGTLEDPGDIPGEDEGNSEAPGDTSGNNEGTLEDPGDIPGDNEGENLGSPIVSNAPVIPALTTYTVSYVANGTSLLEDKVVSDQAIGTVVVETAVVIEGYTPNESTKSLTLSESGNIIIFSYTVVEVPQEMPAVTLTAIVEENIVTLSADAGVLPAGATLSVRLLPEEEKLDYLSALETEQGVTLNQSMAFDITLLDEQGNEIQPTGEVTVSFSNVEFVDTNDEVLVYHFEPQEENAPKGKLGSSPHKGKKIAGGFKISNKLARLYGKKVTFNTEHFSIYIVGSPTAIDVKHENETNSYAMYIGDTLTLEEKDLSSGGTWSITKGGSLATLAVDSSNSRKCTITAGATGRVTVQYRSKNSYSNFYIQIIEPNNYTVSYDTITPAVETTGNENAGVVTAEKTANWIDEENRIAEIKFNVEGVSRASASDVILVMDVSGSMSDRIATAKQASNKFIDELLGDGNPANNRVAFIPFSHGSNNGGAGDTEVAVATKGSLNFSYDIDALKGHVNATVASGGTNYTAALQKAIHYAASRYEDEQSRTLYVVFMSDGAPGYSGDSPNDPNWNGTVQAATLRGAYKATIYTVGIQMGSSGASALEAISSSDSNDQKLYQSVSNMDDLEPILQTIAGQIVNAGTNAVIEDVISEYFDYYNDDQYPSHGTYNETDKSVTISVGDITQDAKTYKIYVQLKDQYWNTNGSYPTNDSVLLTYTDINGDPASNDGLGDPKVEVAVESYTVTYAAGANGSINGDSPQTVVHGGSTTEVEAVPDPGYYFVSWEDGNTNPKRSDNNVTAGEDHTATFMPRTDISYTVKYVAGDSQLLADKEVGDQIFGTTVTETAPSISG
ncbi:MAG: VWA domain-containing protein, partial [Syntrophomonadaceae bacterium]